MTSWRLIHRDPNGGSAVTIAAESSVARLESFRVRGDGDCLEAQLVALASDVGIGPRDLITLEVTTDGSTWTPVYSGVITKPGALRSADLSDLLAVGLSKRVREVVTDGSTYDPQDVAELVRALATTHLPDGVVYDAALVPDLGFEVGTTQVRFNNLGDVLDQLAATCPAFVVPTSETYAYDGVTYGEGDPVPRVTWGVDAQRRFFFRRVSGSLALTEGEGGTRVDALTPSAEEITTSVAFVFVGDGGFAGGLKVDDATLISAWGESVRIVSLPTSLLTANDAVSGDTLDLGTVQQSSNGGSSWTTVTGSDFDVAYLSDDDPQTLVRAYYAGGAPGDIFPSVLRNNGVGVQLAASVPLMSVRVKATALTRPDNTSSWVNATLRLFVTGHAPIDFGTGTFDGYVVLPDNTSSNEVFVGITTGTAREGYDVRVDELVPFTANVADLERLARGYYRAPALERLDVTKPGLTLPTPTATVTLAAGATVTLDVADAEVRITREAGLVTVVHLGQGDDADLIAQAALITGKATRAQLNAIDTLAGSRRRA